MVLVWYTIHLEEKGLAHDLSRVAALPGLRRGGARRSGRPAGSGRARTAGRSSFRCRAQISPRSRHIYIWSAIQ